MYLYFPIINTKPNTVKISNSIPIVSIHKGMNFVHPPENVSRFLVDISKNVTNVFLSGIYYFILNFIRFYLFVIFLHNHYIIFLYLLQFSTGMKV